MEPRAALVLAVEIYAMITVLDVLLAWVQPEPQRVPRLVFHGLTEPVQRPLRALMARLPTGGWDLSPLLVLGLLTGLRLGLLR